jgi:hypothetical protein
LTAFGEVENGKAVLHSDEEGKTLYTATKSGAAVGLTDEDGTTYYGFGGVNFVNGSATVT